MTKDPKNISFNEMREFMGEFIQYNPASKAFWDLMTCLRGPDSPSERPDMNPNESSIAYAARRERKARTVEVIRGKVFGGIVGGAARSRTDRNYVLLPPQSEWDHFDKHVQRAASTLGLEVKFMDVEPIDKAKWKVKVDMTPPPPPVELKTKMFGSIPPAKPGTLYPWGTEKLGFGGKQFIYGPTGWVGKDSTKGQQIVTAMETQKAAQIGSLPASFDVETPVAEPMVAPEGYKYQFVSGPSTIVSSQQTKELYEKMLGEGGETLGGKSLAQEKSPFQKAMDAKFAKHKATYNKKGLQSEDPTNDPNCPF